MRQPALKITGIPTRINGGDMVAFLYTIDVKQPGDAFPMLPAPAASIMTG